MRLWSVDPALLDRAALIAGWREGLLAQKVLDGRTRGYRSHPQLVRFQSLDEPVGGMVAWLEGLADEADRRGYRFDRTRLLRPGNDTIRIELTDGQLELEWHHLRAKVRDRDASWWARIEHAEPAAHPMFTLVAGPVAPWERAAPT